MACPPPPGVPPPGQRRCLQARATSVPAGGAGSGGGYDHDLELALDAVERASTLAMSVRHGLLAPAASSAPGGGNTQIKGDATPVTAADCGAS